MRILEKADSSRNSKPGSKSEIALLSTEVASSAISNLINHRSDF